jgi:probable F420-dependent oxidoreductase
MPGVAQDWQARLLPAEYQQAVAVADQLGFAAITVSEHLVLPLEEVGRLGAYWPHATTVMAFVAGATRRIRMHASVLILPLHHPIALAKAISTLDVLSGGRVTVAVGVGHAQREFEALGVPFHERGRIVDEMLDLMKVLWGNDEPAFHGTYFQVDGVAFAPRPVQQPHPPIWVGGNSKTALRRAARHDGWIANSVRMDLAEIPRHLEYLGGLPDFANRTGPFDVAASTDAFADGEVPPFDGGATGASAAIQEAMMTKFSALQRYGVTFSAVPLPPLVDVQEYVDFLHWFAEQVMPAFDPRSVTD